MSLALGDTVHVRMTKWGDRPHWQFDAVFLGNDENGSWLGFPKGTLMTRPGASSVAELDQVGLAPPGSWPATERGWVATFHQQGAPLVVYVDVTAPPVWTGSTLNAVDLDLDVVRRASGEVFVDDEDEFALHQVELDYPADVIAAARASADRLLALVGNSHAPYDGSAAPWFDVLASLRD